MAHQIAPYLLDLRQSARARDPIDQGFPLDGSLPLPFFITTFSHSAENFLYDPPTQFFAFKGKI